MSPAPAMFERAVAYTRKLLDGEPLSVPIIRRMFDVSRATAKRDLLALERTLPVRRVHGVIRLSEGK